MRQFDSPGSLGTGVLRERVRNRHGTGGTVELGVEIVGWQRTEREITGRYRLFGNVGPDFSDASGSIRGFELQL